MWKLLLDDEASFDLARVGSSGAISDKFESVAVTSKISNRTTFVAQKRERWSFV